MIVNPITVNNCFPLWLHAGWSGLRLYDGSGLNTFKYVGLCLMLWLWSGPLESYFWCSFASAFQLFLAVDSSSLFHLCTCVFDLYVLRDVALMNLEPFTRTEQMSCVYHGRTESESCGHIKRFKHVSFFLLNVPRWASAVVYFK